MIIKIHKRRIHSNTWDWLRRHVDSSQDHVALAAFLCAAAFMLPMCWGLPIFLLSNGGTVSPEWNEQVWRRGAGRTFWDTLLLRLSRLDFYLKTWTSHLPWVSVCMKRWTFANKCSLLSCWLKCSWYPLSFFSFFPFFFFNFHLMHKLNAVFCDYF